MFYLRVFKIHFCILVRHNDDSHTSDRNMLANNNVWNTYFIDVHLGYWSVFAFGATALSGQGLLIHEVSRSHSTTHHSLQRSSGRVISSSQRPLPPKTQHSQQTDNHASGGIRTHNLNRRAAADLRLRPRGHWDRLVGRFQTDNINGTFRKIFLFGLKDYISADLNVLLLSTQWTLENFKVKYL